MASLKLALSVDTNNPNPGDIYLGADSNDRLTSTLSEEVAQLLYTRFRFFQGEWFLDGTIGTPWFQSVLGQKVSIPAVTQLLKRVVTTCPGVASVQRFTLTQLPSRGVRIDFACTLTDGEVLNSNDFQPFVIGG